MNKYKQIYAPMHNPSKGVYKPKYKNLNLHMKDKYYEQIDIKHLL